MLVLFVVYLVQAVWNCVCTNGLYVLPVLYSGACTSLVSSPDYPHLLIQGSLVFLPTIFWTTFASAQRSQWETDVSNQIA